MIIDRLKKKNKFLNRDISNLTWNNFFQTYVSDEDMLKESTYNKCVKFNAESVAKCSIKLVKQDEDGGEVEYKDTDLYNRLTLRPNKYMNIAECMKTFIALGEHEGISALYILNDGQMYPARIEQILVAEQGIFGTGENLAYNLDIAGNKLTALSSQCIIYRSGISWDSIRNVNSNKEYLSDSVATTNAGQKYLSKLFTNGMCSKILVQQPSDVMTIAELKKKQADFNSLFNTDGRMFVAPYGTQISALNMTLADSQFKEIRSLSRIEIANAFGLTPSMIGEGTGNYEEENMRYLQDTLLFKLKSLEQEFNYKLISLRDRQKGISIKYNINSLLRVKPEVQKNIIVDYVKNGIYSLEYARQLLGAPGSCADGTVLLPSGEITLQQLLSGKGSWIKEGNGEEQKQGENNN